MKKAPLALVLITLALSLSACGVPPAPVSGNQQIGYVRRAYAENGKRMIDVDLGEGFFRDQEAGRAIREDDPDCARKSPDRTCQPLDGYYVRNRDTAIRTLAVSDDAQVLMETFDPYRQEPGRRISFEDFGRLLSDPQRNFRNIPFWIETSGGTVVTIREQFIP